jgi:hypothetical protein
MKHLILSAIFIFSASVLMAFTPKIHFYGYIVEGDFETIFNKNKQDTPSLDEVWVEVTSEGEIVKTMQNRTTGFFSLILECGKKYQVSFRCHGYISKTFEIDGTKVPEKDFSEAFKLFTDITLFPVGGIEDTTLLTKAPVARCQFDTKRNNMTWDMDYAKIAFDHFLRVTGAERNFATIEE